MAAEESVYNMDWLKAITAAPTVYVEVLGSVSAPAGVDKMNNGRLEASEGASVKGSTPQIQGPTPN